MRMPRVDPNAGSDMSPRRLSCQDWHQDHQPGHQRRADPASAACGPGIRSRNETVLTTFVDAEEFLRAV
jgi:hypothetical protein